MKKFNILIFFSLVIFSISGNTTVQFIDGSLEVMDGNIWQKLSSGDSVTNESVIRVGENTVVELLCEKSKYTLTQPGTYPIDSLIKKGSRALNTQSFILRTILNLFNQPITDRSDVLGVRGAEAPQEGFVWSNDEFSEYLESGKGYLEEGKYEKAKDSFTDALDNAFEDNEVEEAGFYLTYMKALTGELTDALSDIADLTLERNTPFYNEAVLLKANLLIANNNFKEAISWIEAGENETSSIDESLMLLKGIAYLQLGNIEISMSIFKQIKGHNPESEYSKLATDYLAGM